MIIHPSAVPFSISAAGEVEIDVGDAVSGIQVGAGCFQWHVLVEPSSVKVEGYRGSFCIPPTALGQNQLHNQGPIQHRIRQLNDDGIFRSVPFCQVLLAGWEQWIGTTQQESNQG